jgi:hypothetical protein
MFRSTRNPLGPPLATIATFNYHTLAAMHSRIQQLPPVLRYTWEGGNTHKVVNAVVNKLPIQIELISK